MICERSLGEVLEDLEGEDIADAVLMLPAYKIQILTEALCNVDNYDGTMIAETIAEMLSGTDENVLKDALQLLKDKGVEPWKNLR